MLQNILVQCTYTLDLLPYVPAVNHLFYENLRSDSEANKALDPEELD
jgi:hypothetical protein